MPILLAVVSSGSPVVYAASVKLQAYRQSSSTEGNITKFKFVHNSKRLLVKYAATSPVLSSLRSVPPCQESLGQGWDPFLGVVLHWCARGIRMDAKRES